MSVLDLGKVILDTISSATNTTLNGILFGNGSKVGTKALDTSSLTNDNDHVPTSGIVKSAISDVSDIADITFTPATNVTMNASLTRIFKVGKLLYIYIDCVVSEAQRDVGTISGVSFKNEWSLLACTEFSGRACWARVHNSGVVQALTMNGASGLASSYMIFGVVPLN